MRLALYCPHCGYYEQEADSPGRRGDYCTSVSVGSLFGELLAFQFARWLDDLAHADHPPGRLVHLVEAGAHDGRLALDILGWLRGYRPELLAQLEYWIIEPSPRRQCWQQRTLAGFADKVRWLRAPTSPPRGRPRLRRQDHLESPGAGITGIIFSNELLDAFPVRRLGWDARGRTWFEWGVALQGGQFVWARLPPRPRSALAPARLVAAAGFDMPDDLIAVLPDGFTLEVCPSAAAWWRSAASLLRRGRLLTFDYGLTAAERLAPQRAAGTLRAYRRHAVVGDVLAHPGRQDITAHVNFTALRAAGEAAGLTTETFTSQASFLVDIARRTWQQPERFGAWTGERRRQFQTLVHPDHMGRAYRVLVQRRGD